MRFHLLAAAAVFALAPATAAASPWSVPTRLSSEVGSEPDVAVNSRGDAVGSWTGAGYDGVWIAPRPAGALVAPARRIAGGSGSQVAINDGGIAAVAWSAGAAGVRAAVGPVAGDLGPIEIAGGSDHPAGRGWWPLDVAINGRGDVVVAWAEPVPSARDGYPSEERRLVAAWKPAAGAFGEPQVLGTYGLAREVHLTLDDGGQAVLVWQVASERWRPAPDTPPVRVWVAEGQHGAGFGTPRVLSGTGPRDNAETGLDMAGNARGDVAVAWGAGTIGSAGSTALPLGTYATLKRAGGSFEPARLVVSSSGPPLVNPAVAIDPRGAAAVSAQNPCEVAVIMRRAGADWGVPREAWHDCETPPGDAALGIDAAGRALVATGGPRGDGGDGPLRAARLSRLRVESPVVLSTPRSRNFAPALDFDAVGNGLLAWEGEDAPNPDRNGFDATRPIQFAVYDGSRPAVSKFGLASVAPAFRFRLSEPARVTVRVMRLKPGRGRKVGTLHGRGLRGKNVMRSRGRLEGTLRRRGRYSATITARDSANKQAKPRRFTFGPVR